ncbi:sensor domain-containing diguanylate cyclase [Hoeflea sp.]|uniref:sensor domain-containing diguanylate cyclase n=1 Tax=Hoeflea sp. TaxID=1940281 RepID=UPI0025C690A9|nr:sensor domain-containing diguanylate cyclase [Hoeflea sp.]MBU4528030.1 sensor domain-containing diguanylate cyclase [Alphaproteobacteria bacterium]MBV1785477.1 sensor domain-containing diguanylate cyclase [Hoeflea sp.]
MTDVFLDAEGESSCSFFRQIVMESADAVVAVTPDQRVVLFSPAAEKLFGYSRDEMIGKPLDKLLPQRYRSDHAAKVEEFHSKGTSARYMGDRKSHLSGLRKDGTELLLGATILTVTTERGPIMVAMVRDISERIMLQNELVRLASADPLTGQLNRRAFLESFEREWSRALRYKSGLSLLMLDIDHFKHVNDAYGHDVGDQVICRVAELVRSSLRDLDILGRWGGEEFIAVLPHTEIRAARSLAERIRETIAGQSLEAEGHKPFSVTVSIGLAEIGAGGTAHQQMIKFADNALYEAKNAGRNQVVIWNANGSIRVCADSAG